MYSEKNIFKMIFPLNCLFLGDAPARAIQVKISDTIIVDNCTTKYEDITVSDVKSLILSKKGFSYSPDNLNLWKVDRDSVIKNIELLETFSTENDIKEKLGGKLMQPLLSLNEYFNEDSFKDKKSKSAINIIVQRLTTTTEPGKTIGEIIKEITKDLKERKPKSSYESNDMPLQQRDFSEATNKIEATAVANIERKIGNSNYWCIVSAGAPGIGKTRFGIELFDYIKKNWNPPKQWGDVHFEYLYMNFRNGLYLKEDDSELIPEVILGLRAAYAFFIEKKYAITFDIFCVKALVYGKSIFKFDSVIYYYYESLKFSNNQKLFLYLHIDEFQMIDEWDAYNKTKQFFKNMIRGIAKFMTGDYPTFIQPFLSGTTPRAIAQQKQATDISFQFVDCPLLDIKSMIRIMDHFATKFKAPTTLLDFEAPEAPTKKDAANKKKRHTGGLPRALEKLLDVCFKTIGGNGKKFFEDLEYDYDNIFSIVKNDLEKMYDIYRKVDDEMELYMNLLYHCVEGIPVEENKRLDNKKDNKEDNKGTTVKDLQTDGHFALSSYDGRDLFLIEMPFLFVCIYNDKLKIVDVELMKKAFSVNNNYMYWQEWELFVAHHISFRVNLAIKMGKNELSLRNLHPGAYGTKEDLDIVMKLKRLGIYRSREQFPLNLIVTDNSDGSKIPWDNGHCVVVNGTSAESSDMIYVMEGVSGFFYIIMVQNKWDYGSEEIKEENVSKKNVKSIKRSNLEGYETKTIIFTTQPYKGNKNLPEILIVSKDNFKSYFGPVFSARATFSLTRDINPNFWDINRLKNTLMGIGNASIYNVAAKRPYISEDHFYSVNPRAVKKQKLDLFPFDVQGTEIYAPII
ncbi:uncharacterized protein OCT59_006777 [Rhizophagus irregularis]|uniref:uncharacterized protein n=1 Tax=Rhizophagus irregularis TaxID=588596 RepID=UPI003325E965|nr:hypothetical protein OCT59_006777 [Rhizophagus irregularis]